MPRLKKKSVAMKQKQDKQRKRGVREQEKRITEEEDKKKRKRQKNKSRYKMNRDKVINASKTSQTQRLRDTCQLQLHRSRNIEAQRRRLADESQLQIHRSRNAKAQRRRLADESQLQIHRSRNTKAQRRRLADESQLQIHRSRNAKAQRRRLADESQLQKHRFRNAKAQRRRLADESLLQIHRSRNAKAQRRRLANECARQIHTARSIKAQKRRLANESERHIHRVRNIKAQKCRLSNEHQHQIHKARIAAAQKRRLSNAQNRQSHLIRLRKSQQKRLSNEQNKIIHHQRLILAQKQRLKSNRTKVLLTLRRAYQRKKRNITKHKERLNKLRNAYKERKISKLHKEREKMFSAFRKAAKIGPSYECDCCSRLWFKSSVKETSVTNRNLDILKKTCLNMAQPRNSVALCSTCYGNICKGTVPSLSLQAHPELQFPEIPAAVKKLSPCEERFLCPRLPFMQIREVAGDRQYHVHGRTVNVPTSVDDSVKILPRIRSETSTVPVALKRKKQFRQNYMFEVVRPKVIIEAAKELANSELFREEHILVDVSRFESQPLEHSISHQPDDEERENDSTASSESDEENKYAEERGNVPDMETLIQSDAIIFAPGEGRQPLSLFRDLYVEAKSFIKIYGGKLVSKPSHLSYQNWVKSEVMRADRRCASCIPKLFFSALKLRASKISQSIGFCLRKSKYKTKTVKVEDLLNESSLNNILLHDSGYKIFAPDRGSPAFFEEKKKELFAMLRQLGTPTFFITLSPAETKWGELLVTLHKVIKNTVISENDALELSYDQKISLVREDPVTCARYVDYRMRELLKLMKKKDSFFREHEVLDSYFRVEFQQRGSPHLHGFLWLANAPVYKPNENNEDVIKFINTFVTATRSIEDKLVPLQTHRHTFTCFKRTSGKKSCRFDIPFFPMKETVILEPLDDGLNTEELKNLKKKREEIQSYLTQTFKDKKKLSFSEFFRDINVNEEEYLKIIRSNIKRPMVLLRRNVDECMINPYNSEILHLHRANMDIQFILDGYSCANYVLNYVNKSRKGLSRLLHDVIEDVRKGNLSLREQFRVLANHFLNASEFSAQEAVYYILGMPLSRASRDCIFINTSHPDKRVAVTKSKSNLQNLPKDSTDIFTKTILDHYCQRPDELENMCLAKFAANYNYSKKKPSRLSKKLGTDDSDYDEDTDSEREEDPENVKCLPLKDNSGFVTKRSKEKCIRYVRFNKETYEDDYFREHLMLFKPWRNEVEDLLNINHFNEFTHYFETIMRNKMSFVYSTEMEDLLMQALFETEGERDDGDNTPAASETDYQIFDTVHEEGDIFVDMGVQEQPAVQGRKYAQKDDIYFPVPFLISDCLYNELLISLNEKQRIYLLHILNLFKTNALPVYDCILGGAGVGKSHLISAIQQCLIRHFNKTVGASLDLTRVLLCAFTGKAATHIKGITLHTAFILPHNQFSGDMPQLSSSVLNTVYAKLYDLKLIIIDEISMVSSSTLARIDNRLKQIFRSSSPFGGISIVAFGDFKQLGPVADSYIFQPDRTNPYGPLVGNPLWELFNCFELTQIMRQKDDAHFAAALNNLGEGRLNDQQIKLFQSREVNESVVPDEALRLYLSNADVNAFNESRISRKQEIYSVSAKDTVQGQGSRALADKALHAVRIASLKDTRGLPTLLKLSIGIRYMMTNNIDIPDGLVNGAVGILKHIDFNDVQQPVRLWIHFDGSDVGENTRKSIKIWPNDVDRQWTPVLKETRNIKPLRNATISVNRHQFPLVAAEAITIHKSQGGTYTHVAVNVSKKLARSELYVAFSRCTSSAGLFLIGKFKPPAPPNPYDDIQVEIRKLKRKPIKSKCLFSKNYKSYKILYHNVQSFKAHFGHIKNDSNYLNADLLILAESWLKTSDVVDFPPFKIVARQDVHRCSAHAYGLIVLSKDVDSVRIVYQSSTEKLGCTFNLMTLFVQNVALCCGYISPSTPFNAVSKNFSEMLELGFEKTSDVILMGDFNQNVMGNSENISSVFQQILRNYNLESKLNPTSPSTDGGTQIDICFASASCSLLSGFCESYFSYHKPLLCVLLNPDEAAHLTQNRTPPVPAVPPQLFNSCMTSRLQNVSLDGVYLYEQLRQNLNIDDNIETVINITTFLRQSSLYNGQFKKVRDYTDRIVKVITTGDGSCFYHAVSLQMTGSESLTYGLRAIVSAHMIYNEEYCEQLNTVVQDSITPGAVLDFNRFAELTEINILAQILDRNIDILEAGSQKWLRISGAASHSKRQPLRLLLEMQHYSAIRITGTHYHYEKEFFSFPSSLPSFKIFVKINE